MAESAELAAAPARPRVVVVGSLHYDIMVATPYLPRRGETLMGEAWWWKPGGKGGNQAMAAARHGAAVEMVGCLGDDGFGTRLREQLAAAGVGLGRVRTVVQGSGMSVALQETDGDYAAVVVSGANRDIDEQLVADEATTIRAGRVLVLQNEVAERASAAAARIAREAGVTVVHNAAPARPVTALAGLVDILVVNAVEAEQAGGGHVDDLDGAGRAARSLLVQSPTVVVTAGDAGLAAATGDGTITLPAHQLEHVETHGAGDVFTGALAARIAAAEPLPDALRYANAAAALHVGTPAPERDAVGPMDVQRLLEGGAG